MADCADRGGVWQSLASMAKCGECFRTERNVAECGEAWRVRQSVALFGESGECGGVRRSVASVAHFYGVW